MAREKQTIMNNVNVIALYTAKVKCQYLGINDDYADYNPQA